MENPLFPNTESSNNNMHITTIEPKTRIVFLKNQSHCNTDDKIKLKVFRYNKKTTLKHISMSILIYYHGKPNMEIHIDDLSKLLGIQRRRIYDIVNILEGFNIFIKKIKNIYTWKGTDAFLLKLRIIESIGSEAHKDLDMFEFKRTSSNLRKKSLTHLSILLFNIIILDSRIA